MGGRFGSILVVLLLAFTIGGTGPGIRTVVLASCESADYAVSDYDALRSLTGVPGDHAELTTGYIAGCFSYASMDPNGNGDDGGIVIAVAGAGFWVRHIANADSSAVISPTRPVELDWFQPSDGQDITALWTMLASTYAPQLYIRVPHRPGTYDLGPFDTDSAGIDRLRIYESSAQVTIRQRDPGERWMRFGTMQDLVLGSRAKAASRDDYNLTFQGSAHRIGFEYDAETGAGMILLDPSYQAHCACNWYLRVNTRDAFGNGIKKSGEAHVDTIFVSGRHVNSSVEFSDFGKSFIANDVIVVEDLYVSDPYGAGYGWKGDPGGATVSGAWSKNRGIRISGARKVLGSVELQYGWPAFRSFFTDVWGDPGAPFTITVRDHGFLGAESGYAGVKLIDSSGILHNSAKWDGQMAYDGVHVIDDPDSPSHQRHIHFSEANQWGTNGDILSGFIEATLCDDNPNCTEDSALRISYFDITLSNVEEGFRGNTAGSVGIPYDRIHHLTFRGDGTNPASKPDSEPVKIAADHLTYRDGQFHDLIYAQPPNLGDPGVTTIGNLGENLTITGAITIEPKVDEVTLNDVTWTGSARTILTIPTGTTVEATNFAAPVGSTIDGGGTFTLHGQTTSAPVIWNGDAPTTPGNIMAAGVTSVQVDLQWSPSIDNFGVSGYRIYRDGVQVGTSAATTFSDVGVLPLTPYSYTVIAFDADGNTSSPTLDVSATTPAENEAGITLPSPWDWTDHGIVVPRGVPTEWDYVMRDAISPSTVVKKNGLLHLYYVGALGTRQDGGAANRALGVATSTDGLTWTKYAGNPVLQHQPDGGHNFVMGEGVRSAGADLDANGDVVLYFGGMESVSSSEVDSDGVLATSADGTAFNNVGDVIDHSNPAVYRGGDEIYPVGAYRSAAGSWHVYYLGVTGTASWDLGLASGPARNTLDTYAGVLDLTGEIRGGGDPVRLSPSRIAVPIGVVDADRSTVEVRTTAVESPADLSRIAATYDFGNIQAFTMYVDEDIGKWFLFYTTSQADGVRMLTAPVSYIGSLMVTMINPLDGAALAEGDDLQIEAEAFDPDQNITGIEFFADGKRIGEDQAPPYAYTWKAVSAGTHALNVRVTSGATTTALSDTVTIDVTTTPTLDGRVTNGLRALYRFQESAGSVVHDVSGIGDPLHIDIAETAAVTWRQGSGLSVNSSVLMASSVGAGKVIDAARFSDGISVEAWIEPSSTAQVGPARIVTISTDLSSRNVSLVQGPEGGDPKDFYAAQLRTTTTDDNGLPALTSNAGTAQAALQHVVFTRAPAGEARIFIDGAETVSGTIGGDLSGWDSSYRLGLANEMTGDRPWLGAFRLAAVYGRVLTATEVVQNFDAGPPQRLGDLSGDGRVTSYDASLALKHAEGSALLSGAAAQAGDVTESGLITTQDAESILSRAVGLLVCFRADRSCP